MIFWPPIYLFVCFFKYENFYRLSVFPRNLVPMIKLCISYRNPSRNDFIKVLNWFPCFHHFVHSRLLKNDFSLKTQKKLKKKKEKEKKITKCLFVGLWSLNESYCTMQRHIRVKMKFLLFIFYWIMGLSLLYI